MHARGSRLTVALACPATRCARAGPRPRGRAQQPGEDPRRCKHRSRQLAQLASCASTLTLSCRLSHGCNSCSQGAAAHCTAHSSHSTRALRGSVHCRCAAYVDASHSGPRSLADSGLPPPPQVPPCRALLPVRSVSWLTNVPIDPCFATSLVALPATGPRAPRSEGCLLGPTDPPLWCSTKGASLARAVHASAPRAAPSPGGPSRAQRPMPALDASLPTAGATEAPRDPPPRRSQPRATLPLRSPPGSSVRSPPA